MLPTLLRAHTSAVFVAVALSLLICLSSLLPAIAQIPCDDAYGAFCAEDAGWGVRACLKKLDSSALSSECVSYIAVHDACEADINQHCAGKEFTGK